MRQVLFHIPLKVSWLPAGVSLSLVVLLVGMVVGLLARVACRRASQRWLRDALGTLSTAAFLVGFIGAALAHFLADRLPEGIPIYGYGMMLFLAFIFCTWLGAVRAEQIGISRENIQDLSIWLFISGLVGARAASMLEKYSPLSVDFYKEFPTIWDGGIILYGGIIGGLIGFAGAWWFIFRKQKISPLVVMDVMAPSLVLGVCLGRIGCFLNGCCYGYVACASCAVYPIHFPLSAPPRHSLVEAGYQTVAGFTIDPDYAREGVRVMAVDPASPADASGLRSGDVIVATDWAKIHSLDDLMGHYDPARSLNQPGFNNWPKGKNDLKLRVRRGEEDIDLPPFAPHTLGLYPTQLYESISMLLLLLVLLAYEPFRHRPGQLIAVLMMGYAVHRYLNELLREDPRPKGFERYTSLILLAGGLVLWIYLALKPATVPVKESKSLTG